MSNALTNFLTSSKSGYTSGYPVLKDYQHASRLYVDSTYKLAPKFGFLYFVQININPDAVIDQQWLEQKGSREVGLLAKKVDLPKFTIATETLNQYNRKTVVQTKLNYSPVTIELHDDNTNITHNLWLNYYKHYYADSLQADIGAGTARERTSPDAYRDTKYGVVDYTYGRYDRGTIGDFIKSIDIFVLYQQKFTQYTLINPKINEWAHDGVNQAEGNKVMQNKMQISYENVVYKTGIIEPGKAPETWLPVYYDNTPSPYQVAGNPINNPQYVRQQTGFDKPGAQRVFGRVGGPYNSPNPLLDIAKILAKNYVNKNGVARVKSTGYNIAAGVLGAATSTGGGKFSSPPSNEPQPGIVNLPGGIGINIFKGLNTSVDGKIRANPAALIFPPKR
jgi:hypothetical protein